MGYNAIRIFNFLRQQWLSIIIVILFSITCYIKSGRIKQYRVEQKNLKKEITHLQTKIKKDSELIDSLKRIDGVFVEKIKTIKVKEYEKVYIIDSLPSSELQSFFSNRYPDSSKVK